MKEVITTKYVAFDGKEFSDSEKCVAYEDKCKAKQVYADVFDEYGVKLNKVVEDISRLCRSFKSKSDREFACKHCPLRKENRDFGDTLCLLDHYDFG